MTRLNPRIWQISIFILLLVSLACSASAPGLPSLFATPTPTPVPLPPTIVETVPQVGSELPLQSPLLIYFSEPMDKASVETALTADFTGGFLFNWADDKTLALTPKSPLPPEARINFTLAVSAKSAAGLALLAPLTFSYQAAGPLRVAQTLPAAQAKDVSPDSAIVVAFNQPVVALGADSSTLPAGLTLEPAAQGKGEWLNTSTYIFHPDPGLAGGADYTARVNPQLVAASGATLEAASKETAWAFHTSSPALQDVSFPPTAGKTLDIDSVAVLTFNQPMDRASVESGFAFTGPNGPASGSFEWNDKSTVLRFKPAALLERASQYTLSVSGQSRSRGGATLGSDTKITRATIPAFGVASTSFPNGEIHPSNKNVSIVFSAPLAKYKASELEALITISPKVSYGNFYPDVATVNVNGGFDPGKTYTVTFSANLKDRWGQALGQDYVFTFHQPDAAPSLTLSGQYSSLLSTRPDQPFVDIQAVNVNKIHVALGTFALADFFRYESDFNSRNGYSPQSLDSWNEFTNLPPNDNEPYQVSLVRKKSDSLAPGLYYVDISSDEISRPTKTAQVLLVSNLNLTLKTSATQALLWATDLRTKTPAAKLAVILYDGKFDQIGSGVTDEQGLWQGQVPQTAEGLGDIYAMAAQPGDELFGLASSNWSDQIRSWDFGLAGGGQRPQTMMYIYTERPVYRPGDVVHYRGVVRKEYDGRYSDPGIGALAGNLSDSNGKINTANLAVSPYGTFNGEFTLPAAAAPGDYSINVDTGNDNYIPGGSVSFQVADYRKPEINLSATLAPSPAVSGQALTGSVNAAYFFGAPVNDLPFTWQLYSAPSYFSIPQYQTGLYRTSWYDNGAGRFGQTIAEGKGRTGADGMFRIPLEAVKVDNTTELTLEITASESGGFPVSARSAIIMHPAALYIGIRPDAWFGKAGTELGFETLTVDLEKKPLAGKALTASFQKVTWERSDQPFNYTFTPSYTPLESKQVTSDADGKAHVAFTPAEAGTYMLEVSGDGAKSQALVWVGGAQSAAWPNLPYEHIELTADKDKYKPGDSASVFIPNPFGASVPALITLERSSILSSQIVSIPPDGYTLQLPLTDDHAPNVYVSATLLGPGSDFRQGYVNLPVEPSAFTLNVDLKATPEKAKPGDKLTIDLSVTDSKGQPVQGEFSMAVVDLAALALADPNSEKIVPTYYDIQPLSVQTGLTDAVYAGRFFPQVGGKGGGGGDQTTLTLREKFPDTAYWKADIVTDAQGKAQVTLTLPDSLTTWQVDSIGLTKDTKVGQARVQVKASKDLLIRPQTPRFLVVGDIAQLAAMVNNNTASALEATVSLQAGGFSLEDKATAEQKVQVPANGRIRVAWSGLVQATDKVDAIFTVKAGDLQDASRPNDGPIPVLHYSAPQTFSTAGVLEGAATRQEIIAVPRTFQPLGGKLDVELSPSLASVILGSLEARNLPSDQLAWSNELLASDFLPNLATYQTLADSGSPDPSTGSGQGPALAEKLKAAIKADVGHLLANQSPVDNGWGWTTSSNTKSDPYLTAYILFALNRLGKTDLGIDLKDALQRGRDYLASAAPMDGASDLSVQWVANRVVFQNYVLQQLGGANAPYLDQTYNNRDRLDPWAKALLAETLYGISPDEPRARDLLSSLQTGAIRSATGAHWESISGDERNPGTPLFSTAVVVYSLAQRDPASPLLADAVRYLASQRNGSGWWGSYYESAWILLALNQTMKAGNELQASYAFSAALNGAVLTSGQVSNPQEASKTTTTSTPLTQLNLAGANSLLVSRDAGAGKLYYRAALTIDRPVETAPPLEQGIAVSRKFLSCKDKDCQAVTSFQMQPDVSGNVKVQLTVTLPNDAYYLMVQDAIPAGADILDNSLKTSQQGQPDQSVDVQPTPTPEGPQYDNADPFGDGWGWWYFNTPQIYSDHILWSADYLPAGTYVLTYTIVPSLPGKYLVLPAHAWQAYFPEVQGTSAGARFEIVASRP